MRDILFRGKRIDNGEWVQSGSLIHFNDEGTERHYYIPNYNDKCVCTHDDYGNGNILCIDEGTFYKVIPETVGQYTGLTDKNGKKIFEGDIIQTKRKGRKDEKIYRFVIKHGAYIPEEYCKAIYNQWEVMGFYAFDGERAFQLSNCPKQLEIIGNIHDNPELLKGGVQE